MPRSDAHSGALDALAALLGERLSRAPAELASRQNSETHFATSAPDAVAWPINSDEVQQIMRICHAHTCPVVGWGTGTSLEGHALAINGGIIVDFSKMNRIISLNNEDMTVTVEPGLTREALNEELRATGLFFSVDPGANASLGGMAATRASGTTTVQYGTMRDNVRALRVVLADGRLITTGSAAAKSAAGYDLTALMVGSEGTLGLICELTLKLHGQPEATAAALCAFDDIGNAVSAVTETIQSGIPMARIEFVDAATAAAFNLYASADMPEQPHLMVEFHGSDQGVKDAAERFGEIANAHGGEGFAWSKHPEDRRALWAMRHNAYYACLGLRPGATALVTDICVPISMLAEAVEETRADIAQSPLHGPILGHVGDGNFHTILLIKKGDIAELKQAKALSNRMVERALRMGGTATGEHGVGIGKLDYMQAEHGDGWQIMGDIKRAFDPTNILNPGKLVPGKRVPH